MAAAVCSVQRKNGHCITSGQNCTCFATYCYLNAFEHERKQMIWFMLLPIVLNIYNPRLQMQTTLEQPGAEKALNPASQVLGSVCCCFQCSSTLRKSLINYRNEWQKALKTKFSWGPGQEAVVEDFQEKVVALLDVVGGWIGARTLFFKTSTKKNVHL